MCMQVKCTLTGHEMPLKPDIIQAYAGSRRYSCMLGWYQSPYYQKYKQFLTDCNSIKRKYVTLCYVVSDTETSRQGVIKKFTPGGQT